MSVSRNVRRCVAEMPACQWWTDVREGRRNAHKIAQQRIREHATGAWLSTALDEQEKRSSATAGFPPPLASRAWPLRVVGCRAVAVTKEAPNAVERSPGVSVGLVSCLTGMMRAQCLPHIVYPRRRTVAQRDQGFRICGASDLIESRQVTIRESRQ